MNGTMPSTLDAIEEAARQAATARARGLEHRLGLDAPKLPDRWPSGVSEHAERKLRQQLQLPTDLRLGVYEDANHPLFPGASLTRAVRIQLSLGRRSHIFLGAYQDARLTFSLVAPCRACSSRVPSARIDSLADFGDWLLDGMDRAAESALFHTSPVHRRDCPLAIV